MDERLRQRRRGVARDRGRFRARVLGALLLAAFLAAGFLWLRSSDVFAVRRVILPVTERVTAGEMLAAVTPASGRSLLSVPTDELQRRLAALPYVRGAAVYRRFPDRLEVRLEEYRPFVRVQGRDGRRWLASEDGRVLEEAGAVLPELVLLLPEADLLPEPGEQLPAQLRSALPVVARLDDSGFWPPAHPVALIRVGLAGEGTLVLAGGGEVRLGEMTQLDEKLMVARKLLEEYSRAGRSLEYLDVYLPERPVAKEKAS